MKFDPWPYTQRLIDRLADSSLQDSGVTLTPRPPRSPGLHASTLLKRLHPVESAITEAELRIYGLLGLAFEDRVELALLTLSQEADWPWDCYRPGEVECDGIACSPDILLVPKGDGPLMEMSIKVTWKSTKEAPDGPKFAYYHCVTPETNITMHDLTTRRAGDLQEGDFVLGFDEHVSGNTRHLAPSLVESTQRFQKPCVELTLADRTRVTVSEDHHWLVHTGRKKAQWRQTSKLLQTDRVRSTGRKLTQNASLLEAHPFLYDTDLLLTDEERGYLCGLTDGEGSLSQGPHGTLHLAISQKEGCVLSRVESLLRKGCFPYSRSANGHGVINLSIGTQTDILRFLAGVRPLRLLKKFQQFSRLGRLPVTPRQVVDRKPMGVREVVALQTSTRTFIANGLASHNSQSLTYGTPLNTLDGILLIYFVNGGYEFLQKRKRGEDGKPPLPQVQGWQMAWSEQERAETWQALCNLRDE